MNRNYFNSEGNIGFAFQHSGVIGMLIIILFKNNFKLKSLFTLILLLFLQTSIFATNSGGFRSLGLVEISPTFHRENNLYKTNLLDLNREYYYGDVINGEFLACPTSAGVLSGNQYICSYGTMTTTFSSTVSGGTWSSSNTGVANVNSSTGVVSSVGGGMSIITYTVASSGCTTQTATRTVYVSTGPGAGPVSLSGSNSQCQSSTAIYTINPDPYSYSYIWDYVDGGSGATITTATDGLSSTVFFNSTSTQGNIRVQSVNGCGNGGGGKYIYVSFPYTPSNAAITTQPSTPAATCSGSGVQTITVSATGTGLTYDWKLGGVSVVNGGVISGQGTASLSLTNPTGTNAGSYTVVIKGCGSGAALTSNAVTVTVNSSSTISPITGGATTVCINSVTPAFTHATSGGTWSITNGTGTATITNTGIVTGVTAGTVTVIYTVTGGCGGSASATKILTVNSVPTLTAITAPSTFCSGGTLNPATPTVTSNGSTISSQGWQISSVSGGSTYGALTLPYTVVFADNGKNIQYTATNICGTTTSNVVAITVNNIVTAGAIATNQTICSGTAPLSLTSTTLGTGSGTITYEWQTNASGSYVTISGATAATYSPPILTGSTSYQRRTVSVNSGTTCYSAYTTPVVITVNSATIVPSTAVEGVYTFRIDNPNTYTTATVNGGQYALVNVVQGFTYNFSVGDTFAGLSEVLTILDASNANITTGTVTSTATGASISNWVSSLSGTIKVVLSAGNCAPNGSTGTLGIKLDLVGVNDTKDDQLAYGTNSWIGHVYNFPVSVSPTSVATGAYNAAMYAPSGLRGYAGYYTESENFGIQNFGGGDQYSWPLLSNGVNYTNIDTQTFAVRYRMRSTKAAGCYLVTVKGDDGTRLYIDSNTVVANMNNWGDHGIATYASVLVNFPTNSTNLVFDYYENGGLSQAYFNIIPYDQASNKITPAKISVCSGTTTTITGSYDYDGNSGNTNSNPSFTFSWESKTDSGSWVVIPGVTSLDYTPTALTTTTSNIVTQYRRTSIPVSGSCASYVSDPITITTTAVPATPGAITGIVTQCPSLTSQTYSIAAVANATSYTWTLPVGWTKTAGGTTNSIVVTTGTAGQNGDITVTAKNACVTSAAQTLAVIVNPSPSLTGASQSIFACVGSAASINLTGLLPNTTSAITYTINGGATQTATGVLSNGSGVGSFTTGVLTTAIDGKILRITGVSTTSATPSCAKSFAIDVTLKVKPDSGAITLTPGTTISSGGSTTFSELSVLTFSIAPIDGATSYTWLFPGDSGSWIVQSGAGTNSITVKTGNINQGGNVHVYADNMCESYITVALTSIAPPAPTVTVNADVKCNTLGSANLSNLPVGNWTIYKIKDGISTLVIANSSGSTYTVEGLTAGNYTFTVTNTYGTSVESSLVTIKDIIINTWNGSIWTKGTPTLDQTIVFGANPVSISGQINGCSCQVNSGVTVVVPSGAVLNLKNGLNIQGTLTFENGASLVQENDLAVNTGSIIYKRTASGIKDFDYVYWSSPVLGQTMSNLSPNSDKYYSYKTGNWIPSAGGTMNVGKGYIIRVPRYITQQNVQFEGVPNNGVVPVAVETVKSNLIGNPYPSAIDADAFLDLAINPGVNSALYFWTHNTQRQLSGNQYKYIANDYALYNLSGGTAASSTGDANGDGIPDGIVPSGEIAAGQAFFVASDDDTQPFYFDNSMRISTPGSNSQFFKQSNTKKAAKIEKNRVWLNLTNDGGAFKQLLVGYISGATNDFDKLYDGLSINGNAFVDFYSVGDSKNYTIQGRKVPFEIADEVPLGYNTTIAGTFKINIDKVDGSLVNQPIYLEDKLTNTIHNLKNEPYSFSTEIGTFKDRFVLRYTDSSKLGTDDNQIKGKGVIVSVKNHQIKVNSFDQMISSVKIYDLKGSLIYMKDKLSNNEFIIDHLQSSNQFLIVMTQLEGGKWVSEEIIFQE